MKIGVLTYHRANNYGAYWQACALCSKINQIAGIDAEIIDFRMEKEVLKYSPERWTIARKLKHYHVYKYMIEQRNVFECACNDSIMKKSNESLVSDSIEDFQKFISGKYDAIIVGSDEVWKLDNGRGFPNPYWLPGNITNIKMSYAASSRSDFKLLNKKDHNELKKYLNDFYYISVRDKKTYDSVKGELLDDKRLSLTCDPTFLFDFETPRESIFSILCGYKLDKSKKNIVIMLDNIEGARKIREQLIDKYNLISLAQWHKGYIVPKNVSPYDWMKIIANADLVISSYFHGICYSLIKNTPFIAVGTSSKKDKLSDLLGESMMVNHYIDINEFIENAININDFIEKNLTDDDFTEFVNNKKATANPFFDEIKKISKCK